MYIVGHLVCTSILKVWGMESLDNIRALLVMKNLVHITV